MALREPLISVVVPVYNGARHLSATLRGLIGQRRGEMEIVVVDDGSTDDSAALALKMLERSGRPFRVLRQGNRGVSSARNWGLEEARGAFVLFHDSDDLPHPFLLTRLGDLALREACPMTFCGYDEIREDGSRAFRYQDKFRYLPSPLSGKDALRRYLRHDIWLFTGAVLYHRNFLETSGLRFREHCWLSEDVDFIARALFRAPKVASVPQVLTEHRGRPDSLSTSLRSLILGPGQILGVYAALWRLFAEDHEAPDLADQIRRQQLPDAIARLLAMLIMAGREDVFHRVRRLPWVRELLRGSLERALHKPKIAQRSLELLHFPGLFLWHYRRKKHRLGIPNYRFPGRLREE